MPTTYTSAGFNGAAVSHHHGVIARRVTYEAATALVINDVIKFAKLPANASILDAWLAVDDLDTGTALTLTMRLNDGSAQKNFFSASTVGQAGGVARAAAIAPLEFVTDDDDWWLEVLVAAAPTGGGTGTLVACILYTMNLEAGEGSL
jgi:hypothetical protein